MRICRFHKPTGAALIFACLFIMPLLSAQAPSARAGFDPPVLSVGQSGAYTVTFENLREMPTMQPPRVDGLVFSESPGVSQRSSWINGVSSQQVSLSWRIAAQREGTFSIPEQTITVQGSKVVIPEARLRVVPLNEREAGMFRLEWDFPEKNFYVGEAIPAFLRLAIREGTESRIPVLPEKSGDAFMVTPFSDQVAMERQTIDGIPYTVYIWSVVVTPIRAGTLPLEASITVIYADPSTTRFGADTFGIRRVREQQRHLTTGALELRIHELPTEGRPAGFNGAIGNFEMRTTIGREEIRAGEPMTLTMELTGSGNFDRVSAPSIPDASGWRVYPPRTRFQAEGERGFRGSKTFEYLVIPESPETTETPRIPFAVFNPYTETYEELSVEPRPVAVSPAPAPSSSATVYAGQEMKIATDAGQTWRPNRADPGRIIRTGIRPIFFQPAFWGAQGAVAFAFLGTFFWQKRRHRLVHDEDFARQVVGSRSVRHWTRQASEAAAKGDAEGFYSCAQRALQESVGRRFPRSRRPESLTLAEIEETLLHHPVSEQCRGDVSHLFQTGDALKYARSSQSAEQLKSDAERLVATLRELHKGLA